MFYSTYRVAWWLLSASYLFLPLTCKSASLSSQDITSEIALSYVKMASGNYSSYSGLEVALSVFRGTTQEKNRLWYGNIRFAPSGGVKVLSSIEFLKRTRYEPTLSLHYYVCNEQDYKSLFNTLPGTSTDYNKTFKYESRKKEQPESCYLVYWKLPIALSVQNMIDLVKRLEQAQKIPKYKFIGYDDTENVANCVTFSCRFLKEMGVEIGNCEELNKWLSPANSNWTSYLTYYILGGLLRDNIQAGYVIRELYKNRENVKWKWQASSAKSPCNFVTATIENALKMKLDSPAN